MLELYHFYGATCGLKARLALAEKGVEYHERALSRADLSTPAYRTLNPNGVVPTLVHDGQVLTESTVIINYIDDAFSGPSLKPAAAMGAARALWWMKKADEYLSIIGMLTYTVSMRPGILEKSPQELEAYINNVVDPVKRERRRSILELGFDNPAFAIDVAGMQGMLTLMEATLTERQWLAGDTYSLADTAMTPLIERLDELQFQEAWLSMPKVNDWWQRVKSRPSYQLCVVDKPNPDRQQHGEWGGKAWPGVRQLLESS
ncbi:glutathione S-transferase family protein [Porticoccus sp. GXU_MW_L64]